MQEYGGMRLWLNGVLVSRLVRFSSLALTGLRHGTGVGIGLDWISHVHACALWDEMSCIGIIMQCTKMHPSSEALILVTVAFHSWLN